MQIFIYILWILLPAFFLIHALWVWLEKISGRAPIENPGDYFRQGIFVTICSCITYILDKVVLQVYVPIYSPEAFPLWFYELCLLPIVLTVAAKLYGGSKAIRIEKAPKLSTRKRR